MWIRLREARPKILQQTRFRRGQRNVDFDRFIRQRQVKNRYGRPIGAVHLYCIVSRLPNARYAFASTCSAFIKAMKDTRFYVTDRNETTEIAHTNHTTKNLRNCENFCDTKTMTIYDRRTYKGHADEKYSSYVKNEFTLPSMCENFSGRKQINKIHLIFFAYTIILA